MTHDTKNKVVTPDDVKGPRWIVAPAAVLEDDRLTEVALRVFLALCKRADNETGRCWPSYQRMANDAKVNRASAIRAVPLLQSTGWIEVEVRSSDHGGRATNVYTVNYDNRLARVPDRIGESATEADEVVEEISADDGGSLNLRPPPSSQDATRESHSYATRGSRTALLPERLRGTNNAPPPAGPHATAKTAEVKALLDERAHNAFDAIVACETRSGSTADILSLVHEPITGGASFAWPVISAALVELGGSEFGNRFTAQLVRGMCRRIQSGRVASIGTAPGSERVAIAGKLWRLAAAEGLARPMSREQLLDQCTRLTTDPRVRELGCADGQELFELICSVRLHEFSTRRSNEEFFVIRDLSERIQMPAARAS